MYVLKGFVTNDKFTDNSVGKIAVIGEISTRSRTFSKEKAEDVSTAAPDLTLISFTSANDATATPISTTPDLKEHVLAVAKFVYDTTLSAGGQVYADQLLESLLTQFQTSGQNFECGEIISDGHYWIPEWVSWQNKSIGDNRLKLWFVDGSFQSQFDDYSITIIPPITPLDDFFKTGSAVETEVKAVTLPDLFDTIQQAKGGYPETIQAATTFNYNDPANAAHLVATTWSYLIYGPMGNNVDSINDALVAYILANSTHTRDEWVKIFPDIFRRTEYIMIPLEDQYAIPNRTIVAGIYSPVVNLKRVNALFKAQVPSYPANQVDTYLELVSHPYKSLQIAVVGGADNRNGLFSLLNQFPDLIAVSTGSTDFNRMSQDTQNFLLKLEQMLITAESMGPYTDIPAGYTRVTRDGQLYLVLNYDNIHFLVSAKQNLTQVIPAPSTSA
jgi:hypothetical protein